MEEYKISKEDYDRLQKAKNQIAKLNDHFRQMLEFDKNNDERSEGLDEAISNDDIIEWNNLDDIIKYAFTMGYNSLYAAEAGSYQPDHAFNVLDGKNWDYEEDF